MRYTYILPRVDEFADFLGEARKCWILNADYRHWKAISEEEWEEYHLTESPCVMLVYNNSVWAYECI